MPIDIAALATSVVSSFLLPYIKDGATKVAEALTEKASQAAAENIPKLAEKIWNRVKSVFTSDRDKAVLTEFKEDPEAAQTLMQKKLQTKLEQDPQLSQELDQLVNTPGPDGTPANVAIKDVIGDVGILYMPNANFQQAENVRLAGVMKNYTAPRTAPPVKGEPPKKNS